MRGHRHSSRYPPPLGLLLPLLLLLLLLPLSTHGDDSASSSCSSALPADYTAALQDPCGAQMSGPQAPEEFSILFDTNLYGGFRANCRRARAPVWVDRIFNLAVNGYYDENYFFRVIASDSLRIVQFGTNGNPAISNCYNFQSPQLAPCAILEPQPDAMPTNEGGIRGLSNVRGTLSMSTSFNESTGTTWNATAELFINTGDNAARLDPLLFVPVCTVEPRGMAGAVYQFPSFGEVQELGGPGVSLDALYAQGNAYIQANSSWDTMAATTRVRVVCYCGGGGSDDRETEPVCDAAPFDETCGPCAAAGEGEATGATDRASPAFLPYEAFDGGAWRCPSGSDDTCAVAGGGKGGAAAIALGEVAAERHRWPWQKGGRWRQRRR